MEHLKQSEWQSIQTKAKSRFDRDVLGARPTFQEVRKTIPNRHTIDVLEYTAMILLFVLTAFTSIKIGSLALPFAEETLKVLAQHAEIAPGVKTVFTVITAVLFALLATPSLLYFKLLDQSPEVVAEKNATKNYQWSKRLRLDYITPRLPYIMVYASLAWLFYTSSLIPADPFAQYLPVVAEIGLAALVGNILQKRKTFDGIVFDALEERTDEWKKRKASYESDPAYLRILYQIMRDDVLHMRRRGAMPNAQLENSSELDSLLLTEYRRLTGGQAFALKAADPSPVIEAKVSHSKRIPPRGDKVWTADTLERDLLSRGIGSGYTERRLAHDYETGYDARAVWRQGLKAKFE